MFFAPYPLRRRDSRGPVYPMNPTAAYPRHSGVAPGIHRRLLKSLLPYPTTDIYPEVTKVAAGQVTPYIVLRIFSVSTYQFYHKLADLTNFVPINFSFINCFQIYEKLRLVIMLASASHVPIPHQFILREYKAEFLKFIETYLRCLLNWSHYSWSTAIIRRSTEMKIYI